MSFTQTGGIHAAHPIAMADEIGDEPQDCTSKFVSSEKSGRTSRADGQGSYPPSFEMMDRRYLNKGGGSSKGIGEMQSTVR